MTMDFSGAERQNDFSVLIPQGTLSWGVLKIRPFNLDAGQWETPSKSSEARFLDCEVQLKGGQYEGRKVWTRIGTAGSEKYINMGKGQIRAILEVGKKASEQNLAGYNIASYAELSGLPVAIKIKEEPEQNGYPAKNDVAVFLSPVDPGTEKDYKRLESGDTEPRGKQNVRTGGAAVGAPLGAAPAARWASPQGGAPAAPAPVNPAAPPPWLVPLVGQQGVAPAAGEPAAQPPMQAAGNNPTPPWATK
jgi:hypothetical protein